MPALLSGALEPRSELLQGCPYHCQQHCLLVSAARIESGYVHAQVNAQPLFDPKAMGLNGMHCKCPQTGCFLDRLCLDLAHGVGSVISLSGFYVPV